MLVALFAALAGSSGPSAEDTRREVLAEFNVVPRPAQISFYDDPVDSGPREAGFVLDSQTRVAYSDDSEGSARREAERLAAYLNAGTGWQVRTGAGESSGGAIHFSIVADPGFLAGAGPEAYRIETGGGQLRVEARTGRGLFYASQTLRQWLGPDFAPGAAEGSSAARVDLRVVLEPLTIEDAPRFTWRGMHLDVGRYLYEVEEIQRLLDTMAFYKFNVFHWHLTEDQGWRIEIEKYPRLTEVGAFRKSTPVRGDRTQDDGVPYGGFYTQEQIEEVVAHAADLYIDVMPEIELPGHSTAAIAAYPHLGNPEFVDGLEVGHRWGVHPNTLSPQPSTLSFYEDVFDEVLALFPFEFVHIGGDEAPKTQWRESPTAQARMRELGLETEEELQAWFVAHFERYLSERGRRLVGWDEIHEGGLPAGATMMVWRGWEHGIEAARKGHDIIMAPTTHTYFDYYQAEPEGEPEAIGGLLPLEKVYSFEPVPEELTPQEARHILGAQGQLWSEYLHEWSKVEYMAFPRALALAEVVWSPAELRDWEDFRRRLESQLDHLDARGIGYRPPDPP